MVVTINSSSPPKFKLFVVQSSAYLTNLPPELGRNHLLLKLSVNPSDQLARTGSRKSTSKNRSKNTARAGDTKPGQQKKKKIRKKKQEHYLDGARSNSNTRLSTASRRRPRADFAARGGVGRRGGERNGEERGEARKRFFRDAGGGGGAAALFHPGATSGGPRGGPRSPTGGRWRF